MPPAHPPSHAPLLQTTQQHQPPLKDASYGKNAPGFPFGPTIRVKGGETSNIRLANNLVEVLPEALHTENSFRDPTFTNLHTCVVEGRGSVFFCLARPPPLPHAAHA